MKMMKGLFVLAMVLFLVTPAFAEMSLNGYYRLQGTYYDDGTNDETQNFQQRLRMMLTNKLNENVSFVYFGEVDSDWGQRDKLGNNGAQPGADGVNLETKNVYLALKDDNYSAKLGIQGMGDTFDSILFADDMAGVTIDSNIGPVKVSLLYSMLYENTNNADDDVTLYGATVSGALSSMATLGASVYYGVVELVGADDMTSLSYGLNASVALTDALSLNGFVVGQNNDDGMDTGNTWVANADVRFKFDMGNVKLRYFYAPDEDNAEDVFMNYGTDNGLFGGENLLFIGADASATNNGAGEKQYRGPLYSGAGVSAVILSGQFNLPQDIYAAYGICYLDTDGDELGTEYAVKVGKKFYGNVDVSIRAAQFDQGDYYANPEDATKVIGMINVGF